MVFDDWFTSVALVGGDEAFDPSQWQELFTMSRYQYMFDLTDPNVLSDEWIDSSLEHENKQHEQQKTFVTTITKL